MTAQLMCRLMWSPDPASTEETILLNRDTAP